MGSICRNFSFDLLQYTCHGGCFFCFESSVMCSVLFCDEYVLNGSKAGQGNYRLKDLQCDFMYKYFVGKKASHMQIADFFFLIHLVIAGCSNGQENSCL
jgi:hypothetical protein